MYSFHEGYQRCLDSVIDGIPGRVSGLKNEIPMCELLNLKGKTAIVTGGAMGMGSCIVSRLCKAGARVVIADVAEEYACKILSFFKEKGYTVRFVKTDVRRVDEIRSAVDFTVKEFGGIDILVNNAAVWSHRTLAEITEDSWQEITDVNLKGTLFFVQAAAKCMAKQGRGGKIVNIASVAALSCDPAPLMYEYVASKAGIPALTKSLAREMKKIGVNVNCVIPGGMSTPGARNTQATEAAKELRKGLPRTPTADPDQVGRLAFMLCTHMSDFMYGSSVIADGGAHLNIE